MKTNHTAGPWYVSGTNPPCIFAREGMDIIGQCDSSGEMLRVQELANARLIAAAPELLTILTRILRAHDSGNNGAVMGEAMLCKMFAEEAREAITKAAGA